MTLDRSVVMNDPEDRVAYIRETVSMDLSDVRTVVREIEAGTYPMIPAEVAAKLRRLETTVCLATSTWPESVPYTEPRDGDEVEVTLRGVLRNHCGGGDCPDWKLEVDVPGYERLAVAMPRGFNDKGRVRLVERAAPRYEPGRIYRAENGSLFEYLPELAPGDWPFRMLGSDLWANPVSDLVPCDVVPREGS